MSKVQAIYHIVFSTKHRESSLPENHHEDVYRFIWSQLIELGCYLYRIGGIENHIHMLVSLPANKCLSDVMRVVKANTSGWLRRDERFPSFNGWSKEYFAVTVSPMYKDIVVNYIRNQKEHHSKQDLRAEMIEIYRQAGFVFDDRDLGD